MRAHTTKMEVDTYMQKVQEYADQLAQERPAREERRKLNARLNAESWAELEAILPADINERFSARFGYREVMHGGTLLMWFANAHACTAHRRRAIDEILLGLINKGARVDLRMEIDLITHGTFITYNYDDDHKRVSTTSGSIRGPCKNHTALEMYVSHWNCCWGLNPKVLRAFCTGLGSATPAFAEAEWQARHTLNIWCPERYEWEREWEVV